MTETTKRTPVTPQNRGSDTILIDLDILHTQAELKEEELIQKHVYVALKNRISKRLDWVKETQKEETHQRTASHTVLTGSAGSASSTAPEGRANQLSCTIPSGCSGAQGDQEPGSLPSDEALLKLF